MKNYLTIDVEDYYQVSAFEDVVAKSEWSSFESRVEDNTYRLLGLLEKHVVKATFFIVGWIAEKHPNIVKRIRDCGHEIACHSYWHSKVYNLSPEEFRQDTYKAKSILEDISGTKVAGYRAPSYSITRKSLWAIDILEEVGFDYDSSIFPILHDNYGIPDAPRYKYVHPGKRIIEYPLSTSKFLTKNIPVAGGGYFRLFPYWFSRKLLKMINVKEGQPFIFYLHPWEIDPDQPRFNNATRLSRFRHYNNLDITQQRFEQLLSDFSFRPIIEMKGV